ncbi:hypothetical protein FRC01_006594 [Tulasnella sp. 417]|nr:hypothetical protein FRC01_006594 [Tulasnella sp. 417]
MAPVNIIGPVELFERRLSAAIKTFPIPHPGSPVSLQDFLLHLAHRATGAAYFGPTFDVELFWDDWQGFDDGVYKVALAYPLCPHFVRCRERVIQRFLEHLDDPAHESCEMIAEMERMARDAKLDRRDLAVMIMACYWPVMANVPWGSFWLLVLQLQRSEGLTPILAELDAAAEAVKLKQNDTLIMSTRSVHFDESLFGRDVKEFNHERWIDGLSEDAKGSFGPNGGGVSMCSGRHFAPYHVKIFLTTLLHTFRFEVDKARSPGPSPVTLSSENRGFGLERPQGELFVKVAKI